MMLLLDTHVVLWLLTDDAHLGAEARGLISRSGSSYVSAASMWEIAIKVELGRLEAPDDLPAVVEAAGLSWLSVSPQHAWRSREIGGLPHRDPFDRMLVAQAAAESLTLLTADRVLLRSDLVPALEVVDARL